MSTVIDDLLNLKAQGYSEIKSTRNIFKDGFDCAMELRLGEKFAQWLAKETIHHDGNDFLVKAYPNYHKVKSKDIYNHWLNNVLKID